MTLPNPNLPPPNPNLGDSMRQRDWARREAETYYQMRHAPQPYQYTTDRPHPTFGGGSGTPVTQWLAPQGPPTGFAARQAPVVYSAQGVAPGITRPTYAYNRVVGTGRAPTMYTTTTWPYQAYPGGSNTYIPSWEATGMVIKFTRDADRFRINKYVKDIKVPKDQGYYLTLDADQPYRVVSINDYLWEDSADAPGGRQERMGFAFQPYRTARLCFPFSLGKKSVEQAEWPILAEHGKMMAAKAMTVRTKQMVNLISNSSYWSGLGFTNTGGTAGTWSTSDNTNVYIQKTLNTALIAIEQASGGIVSDEDALHLTFNPTTARSVAVCPEYRTYIQGSPDALSALTDQRNPNRKYGLAPQLYGLDLVVENAIQVTTPKSGNVASPPAQSRSYIFGSTYALISSKPTGISAEGEQSLDFSTVQFRFYENMSVESKSDPDNRREVGRVVEDYTVSIAAPQTGYLVTGIS
jgi:hypothetical protein